MEEDIKILEEQIAYWKDLIKRTEISSPIYTWMKDDKIKQRLKALENLIVRYKELEEQQNKNIQVAYGGKRYNTEGIILKDYIPKSKVKEKIEELNDVNSKFSQRVIKSKEFYLTELVQNILQELLEE